MLKIKNLTVASEGKTIIQDINFRLRPGETHFLMGPNGAGKSTLGLAIMGHPNFKIKQGQVLFRKKNITKYTTDQKAKMGIFLAFQQPIGFGGVKLLVFTRGGLIAVGPKREPHTASVRKEIASTLQSLDMGQ